MEAHAPGPWHFQHDGGLPSTSPTIYAADGSTVAYVWQGNRGDAESRAKAAAKARLIAAVPDLLAALEELSSACDGARQAGAEDFMFETQKTTQAHHEAQLRKGEAEEAAKAIIAKVKGGA